MTFQDLSGHSRGDPLPGIRRARAHAHTGACSGTWKAASYSWPPWRRPAGSNAVGSLLAHACQHPQTGDRERWFPAWGVTCILQSPIRRSGQGGYGTFGPPEVVWACRCTDVMRCVEPRGVTRHVELLGRSSICGGFRPTTTLLICAKAFRYWKSELPRR